MKTYTWEEMKLSLMINPPKIEDFKKGMKVAIVPTTKPTNVYAIVVGIVASDSVALNKYVKTASTYPFLIKVRVENKKFIELLSPNLLFILDQL